jgi:hypothetical protein
VPVSVRRGDGQDGRDEDAQRFGERGAGLVELDLVAVGVPGQREELAELPATPSTASMSMAKP